LDIWLFRLQSQFKPNLSQLKPILSQFVEREKLMQSVYLQTIMKKSGYGQKNKANSNPIEPNFKRDLTKIGHRESAQLKL